jgi:hypothetical protein
MDARATQTRNERERRGERRAKRRKQKEKPKKPANFIILFSDRASRPHTAQRLLARG